MCRYFFDPHQSRIAIYSLNFMGANRRDGQISWNVNASFDGGAWCVVHVHDEGRRNAAARCGQIRE